MSISERVWGYREMGEGFLWVYLRFFLEINDVCNIIGSDLGGRDWYFVLIGGG